MLVGSDATEQELLVKELKLVNYEVVINASTVDGTVVIYPVMSSPKDQSTRIWLSKGAVNIQVLDEHARITLEEMPAASGFYHLRFRKVGDRLLVQVGRQVCGEFCVAPGKTQVGLGVRQGTALLDLVRITKLV